MPREARFNQKDYTHYVVVSKGGVPFIESGWSYPEDARENIKGNLPDGVKAKVVTKIGLKRGGVDPDDNKNWLRGQWWLEDDALKIGPGRPGQKFAHGDVEIETTLHPLEGAPLTRTAFAQLYTQKLQEAARRDPAEYADADKPEFAARTVEKMMRAIETNGARSVSLGPALKATLRALRLPPTYAGLEQALASWKTTLGDGQRTITAHKIEDRGVEHEQYFQGCGISHSKWDEVASGVGSTPMEAYEDALDSLAQNGWDTETLPQDGEGLSKKSEIPEDGEDLHHYVCVYVKG